MYAVFTRRNRLSCNIFVYSLLCHGFLIITTDCKIVRTDNQNGITHARGRSSKHSTWRDQESPRHSLQSKQTKSSEVDVKAQKRMFGDNLVTVPEPFPVNRFVQEPFLQHHVRYVPQPYPVSHVEYVPRPIAVPVEVPNQVKVQHFHVHKDRKFVVNLGFNFKYLV